MTAILYYPGMAERIRDQIREHIARLGVTQRDLAGRVGIKQPHLNRYLTGKADMTGENIEAIAKALGVKVKLVGKGKLCTPALHETRKTNRGVA